MRRTSRDMADQPAVPPPGRQRTSRARWLLPAFLLIGWLALGAVGSPSLGKLTEVQTNDNASFLPESAESTEVSEAEKRFTESNVLPAVVIFERGAGLTPSDMGIINRTGPQLSTMDGLEEAPTPPIPSPDRKAAQIVVPVSGDDPAAAGKTVQEIRERVSGDLPEGLTAHVTGPGGYNADFADVFSGVDEALLLVTASIVAVILIIVYRSPFLPIIVLASSGFALIAASFAIYPLAANGTLTLNGQTQGIMLILIFGAATDYALLLVARYREELLHERRTWYAMRTALRASAEPIGASAGTVIVGMLCMLFSELNSNRGLGPIVSIGIAASLLASLTFLPSALVLCGRAAFWPFLPTVARHRKRTDGIFGRIANLVRRRPRATWVLTVLALIAGVAFVPALQASGVSQRDVFLNEVEAVTGQDTLSRHFPGGTGSPAVIVASANQAGKVIEKAKEVPGVADATVLTVNPRDPRVKQPKVVHGQVQINATLRESPDSEGAVRVTRQLRDAVHSVPQAQAKVGGETANQLDVQDAAKRDRDVIIPIVLVAIFLILAMLLRSLLAPVLLIGTVVLSFGATLGVGALVFNDLLGFPGADPAVPLYAFVFLVALGIDYNIFLMTRVREEAHTIGTRDGTLHGLRVTGGVITSAGVVLAATFAALSVLPILFMVQVAFLVAFGVLLDTLVVRSLLVPALTVDIGRGIWWPSRLMRGRP
ncbi:MAG: MMPL family transporter [Pseudonocardiaceae bacterium]|nr:MMPL family transporter [Pseudonocardiaceae bacterium]